MRYVDRAKRRIQTENSSVLLQLVQLRGCGSGGKQPPVLPGRCQDHPGTVLLRVNPMFILRAFEKGADGVILCGCHPGDCHYTSGNFYARRRMTLLFSMLDYLGVENGRTRVEWVSAAEGVKFSTTMNEFVEKIYSLGKNVRLGDIRCRN